MKSGRKAGLRYPKAGDTQTRLAVSSERPERRLAAILAADVAGYSRLMGADEEGTLAQLKAGGIIKVRVGGSIYGVVRPRRGT